MVQMPSKRETIIGRLRQLYDEEQSGYGLDMHKCKLCSYEWGVNRKHPKPKLCPSCRSTLWDQSDVVKHKCRRCDHVWFSLDAHPVRCSSCKAKTWNSPYLIIRCNRCGKEWKDQLKKSNDFKCPTCGAIDEDDIRVVSRFRKEEKEVRPVVIDEDSISELIADDSRDSMADRLRVSGFDESGVEMVCSFIEGIDPITIARSRKVSFNTVMTVISPFAKVCEKQGRMPWNCT